MRICCSGSCVVGLMSPKSSHALQEDAGLREMRHAQSERKEAEQPLGFRVTEHRHEAAAGIPSSTGSADLLCQ